MDRVQKLRAGLAELLGYPDNSINLEFLVSSLAEKSPVNSIEETRAWLTELNKHKRFSVEHIPFCEMRKWAFSRSTGDLAHESGRFFSIRGLKIQTNAGPVAEWSQPIIHQPEVGLLGMTTKKFDGILHFLVQAKAEPGNINTFQISPTVQATRSNFSRVHGGKAIPYMQYFSSDYGDKRILLDQLQSEQGARFYKKRNRNTIVELPQGWNLDLEPNFRWLTLGQIKRLMQFDNVVNMDTRSIISCASYDPEYVSGSVHFDYERMANMISDSGLTCSPLDRTRFKIFESSHSASRPHLEIDQILFKITQEKFQVEFDASLIPLNQVTHWRIEDDRIRHEEDKYFSVEGVRIETNMREVDSWDQPIVKQVDSGLVGFIGAELDGVLHFLIQMKLECGNLDIFELAPTAQCITGSYVLGNEPPWVGEFVTPSKTRAIYDAYQSEEGGRFYQESNRNCIRIVEDGQHARFCHARYVWMTLSQLKYFTKFSNFLNVEARSVISVL